MLLAASDAGGGSFGLIMIVVLVAAMYFLLIRPQNKRRREAQQMQSSLGPGDEIVTIGGLHGIVTAVDDDVVHLEIAPGVTTRFSRGAVARVVTATPSAESEEPTTESENTESETSDSGPEKTS